MTILEALAILEAAVLECKQRNVDTAEVTEALDFLEPHIFPKWLVPQFRHHAKPDGNEGWEREAQQQVLRPSFDGIRDAVKVLLEVRMDALARKFHETHDVKVKEEIERLAGELTKLKEPWRFVVK
jgi:hypothetical protein